MTTPPDDPPRLSAHRDAARTRLAAFYHPFPEEMTLDRAVAAFDRDATAWQRAYARAAQAGPPRPAEFGLIRGSYPAVRAAGRWYPDPEAYLVVEFQRIKVGEIFYAPEAQRYVRYLCARRHRTRAWVAENLEDVLQEAITSLLRSTLPPEGGRASNDARHFLGAWKDTFACPEPLRRHRQLDLIQSPADNAIRRLIRAELREETNADLDRYDVLAAVGRHLSHGTIREFREWVERHPRLSEKERQVVALRYADGLTLAAIAVQVGHAVGYVHRLKDQALAKLAEGLSTNSNPEGEMP